MDDLLSKFGIALNDDYELCVVKEIDGVSEFIMIALSFLPILSGQTLEISQKCPNIKEM